ncbi:podocalyxin [Porphyrio hochstetteri]
MRAPLLLPLLPLLLLGVRSEDDSKITTASTAKDGPTTRDTSSVPETTTTSNIENPSTTSTVSPTTVQGTITTDKTGNPPSTPVISSTIVPGATHTKNHLNSPSTSAMSPNSVQEADPTNTLGNPSSSLMTSPHPPNQVSPSTVVSTATTAVTPSTAQQKTSPPASLRSSAVTTATSPTPTHVGSPPTTSGVSGTVVTSPTSEKAQGREPSGQLTTTTASQVTASSLFPGIKDHVASSTTSFTKQPQPSLSSPVQDLASSTKSGRINTSVIPFDGSASHTTSKTSLYSPDGSIKASDTATTLTPEPELSPPFIPLSAWFLLYVGDPDQRSHGSRTTSADQSLPSARTPAPAPWDQMTSSSPGHQLFNVSSKNEVICKDQVQNNGPTLYLKEAKTCVDWMAASVNVSFFESFCSTGQHVFNASQETCTVMLSSRETHSQLWAVQAVLHIPLDPEKVLEELKEKKDKLEELGIANITSDKMEREMIINDEFSTPLIITIVTLAGSLLLIAAIYGCCHQRFSQKKDQHIHPDLPGFDDGHVALIFNQRLTEELQTMENGYHDNPTLEVMETSSEMQEKKVNLNGELGDSWIVPLDTLMKEDLEEEDTHL